MAKKPYTVYLTSQATRKCTLRDAQKAAKGGLRVSPNPFFDARWGKPVLPDNLEAIEGVLGKRAFD